MIAYKLVRTKNNKIYPLFINRNKEIEFNKWLKAECHTTKGFKERIGWHCCFRPIAPHLKKELSNGEKRIWVECEVRNFTIFDRPESQGGQWFIAKFLKVNKILS